MSVIRIDGTLDALSPLVHGGDEKTGSTPVLRSLTHWDPLTAQHVRLPFLSGNAIRGVLRRLVMHDLLAQLGYTLTSAKLHHALLTGGVLESTDETAGVIDLPFRRQVRDALPPLGLFGTALGNQMLPGCLRVEHAIPYCAEYRAYLGAAADDPRAQHGVRTFTDVAFATRRDDLRAERATDEQAQQMLVEFEAFIPGTRFQHGFVLAYASALEASCLGHVLTLWQAQPFLGGKSASGYGKLALAYPTAPDPVPYCEYVQAQGDALRACLRELEGKLGGRALAASA
jgi:hypothetical protein